VCNACSQKYAHKGGGGHTLTASLVLRPSSTSSFSSSSASPYSSRQVVLDVTWSDPHGGKLTETFEVDKTGNKMTQTSKILVNDDATTGTCHTPVFLKGEMFLFLFLFLLLLVLLCTCRQPPALTCVHHMRCKRGQSIRTSSCMFGMC
jgi:hypothetical protein